MSHSDAEHFRALYDVARTVTSTLSFPQVLNLVAQSVTSALGAKGCSIFLRRDLGEKLEVRAAYGLSQRYMSRQPVILEQSAIDLEAIERGAVFVRDVRSDPHLSARPEMAGEGVGSLLVVPLVIKGMSIGVLHVYAPEPRDFDQREIDFATAIANLCALAIENATVYETLEEQFEAIRRARIPWAERFDKPNWRD